MRRQQDLARSRARCTPDIRPLIEVGAKNGSCASRPYSMMIGSQRKSSPARCRIRPSSRTCQESEPIVLALDLRDDFVHHRAVARCLGARRDGPKCWQGTLTAKQSSLATESDLETPSQYRQWDVLRRASAVSGSHACPRRPCSSYLVCDSAHSNSVVG